MPKTVEIKLAQLKALMRLKPTLEDTAAFFECSADTIERTIKREAKCSFAEFREQNMVHTRFTLIRTALKKAEQGDNVMLIFCLKNLCGWKDRSDDKTPDAETPVKPTPIAYVPKSQRAKAS
jgi:hypothetical protein